MRGYQPVAVRSADRMWLPGHRAQSCSHRYRRRRLLLRRSVPVRHRRLPRRAARPLPHRAPPRRRLCAIPQSSGTPRRRSRRGIVRVIGNWPERRKLKGYVGVRRTAARGRAEGLGLCALAVPRQPALAGSRENCGSHMTRWWREMDPNPRSPAWESDDREVLRDLRSESDVRAAATFPRSLSVAVDPSILTPERARNCAMSRRISWNKGILEPEGRLA
jgi:hypothetical protein